MVSFLNRRDGFKPWYLRYSAGLHVQALEVSAPVFIPFCEEELRPERGLLRWALYHLSWLLVYYPQQLFLLASCCVQWLQILTAFRLPTKCEKWMQIATVLTLSSVFGLEFRGPKILACFCFSAHLFCCLENWGPETVCFTWHDEEQKMGSI